MVQQVSVLATVLTLNPLLSCCETTESWRHHSNDQARNEIPCNDAHWTLPADKLSQLTGEQYNVKDWLGEVQIKIRKRCCPLICILRKSLIRIRDSRVQVANLVIKHLLQVVIVELLSDALSE